MEYESKVAPAAPSSWLEKWLLVGILTLVVMLGVLLTVGTAPARRVEKTTSDTSLLLCMRVQEQLRIEEENGQPADAATLEVFDELCRSLLDDRGL